MNAFVLFMFLFGQLGPYSEVTPYETLEECETELAALPAKLAEHNAAAENPKVFLYAAACKEVEQAPQGKGV